MAEARHSAWLPRAETPNSAPMRLFVLPFAGGGVAQFQAFCNAAPDWLDVQPVQLPGRENRLFETPVSELSEMVDALLSELLPLLDRPYALLGYSMGARLSFGLAHALAARGHPGPRLLIVAAHPSPALPPRIPDVDTLDSAAFWELIAGYEGTPEEILQDAELKTLVEPTLRADFRMSRQAVNRARVSLDLPILAVAGNRDPYAGPGDMKLWQHETIGLFRLEIINGGHFFLHSDPESFAACVFSALRTGGTG